MLKLKLIIVVIFTLYFAKRRHSRRVKSQIYSAQNDFTIFSSKAYADWPTLHISQRKENIQ